MGNGLMIVKEYIKNSKLFSYAYLKYKEKRHSGEINPIPIIEPEFVKSDKQEVRLNLVVPSLLKVGAFGGLLTAVDFIKKMADEFMTDKVRIISVGGDAFSEKLTFIPKDFSHTTGGKQLVFLGESKEIPISKNDIFVYCCWQGAYAFRKVIDWQQSVYNCKRKAVYIVQDYEPGFYPWSTEYVLSEATYSSKPEQIIAVYNSKELRDFFVNMGYKFHKEYYFNPRLNDALLKVLKESTPTKREKRILLYARPSIARNSFKTILQVLNEWDKKYEKSNEWEIIAMGDKYLDMPLQKNKIIFSGKLTLEQYANKMLTAYAGISLMISPHPSYPPLEMATFGVKTITNSYANKDLTSFSDNIVSVKPADIDGMVEQLIKICDEYTEDIKEIDLSNKEYLGGSSYNKTIKAVVIDEKSIIGELL